MEIPERFPPSQVALAFPDASPEEDAKLEASIARYGQLVPISVQNGEVVDGRRRQAACEKLGIRPIYEFLDDDVNSAQYAVDRNTLHRDLSPSQKAYVAAKLSMLSPRGRPRQEGEKSAKLHNYTRREAAGLMRVGVRQVNHAVKIAAEDGPAVPELRQAVEMGKVQVADAAGVLDQPPEVQRLALARVANGATRTMKRAVRQVKEESTRPPDAEKLAATPSNLVREACQLHVAGIEELQDKVPAGSVDVVITDSHTISEVASFCEQVAAFATHALKDHGILVVIAFGPNLPLALQGLSDKGLNWVSQWTVVFEGQAARIPKWKHDVGISTLPVLVFGKKSCHLEGMDDLIVVPPRDQRPRGLNRIGEAITRIMETFAECGQRVCDPAMGGKHWSALAAWKSGCQFDGADDTETKVANIWDELDRAAGQLQVGNVPNGGSQPVENA